MLTTDPFEAPRPREPARPANRERQELEGQILEEALAQAATTHELARDRAIVLASPGWHPGRSLGSCIAFGGAVRPAGGADRNAGQPGRGGPSGVPGGGTSRMRWPLRRHLDPTRGHGSAGGFSLAPERIGAFRERLLALAAADLTGGSPGARSWRSMRKSPWTIWTWSWRMPCPGSGPHGLGNPEPCWLFGAARNADPPRRVGRNHL